MNSEKGNSSNIIAERDKIIRASSWKNEFEQHEVGDTAYKAFFDMMTYRRAIADIK